MDVIQYFCWCFFFNSLWSINFFTEISLNKMYEMISIDKILWVRIECHKYIFSGIKPNGEKSANGVRRLEASKRMREWGRRTMGAQGKGVVMTSTNFRLTSSPNRDAEDRARTSYPHCLTSLRACVSFHRIQIRIPCSALTCRAQALHWWRRRRCWWCRWSKGYIANSSLSVGILLLLLLKHCTFILLNVELRAPESKSGARTRSYRLLPTECSPKHAWIIYSAFTNKFHEPEWFSVDYT